MSPNEMTVKQRLGKDGFTVLRGGMPDFLCVRDGRCIFVEAKSKHDILSQSQRIVHQTLGNHGIEVHVIRDSEKLTAASTHHPAAITSHGFRIEFTS